MARQGQVVQQGEPLTGSTWHAHASTDGLRLPGVKNVDHALPLREKLRRATMNGVWPDSAIVAVTLDRGDAAPTR